MYNDPFNPLLIILHFICFVNRNRLGIRKKLLFHHRWRNSKILSIQEKKNPPRDAEIILWGSSDAVKFWCKSGFTCMCRTESNCVPFTAPNPISYAIENTNLRCFSCLSWPCNKRLIAIKGYIQHDHDNFDQPARLSVKHMIDQPR